MLLTQPDLASQCEDAIYFAFLSYDNVFQYLSVWILLDKDLFTNEIYHLSFL